MAARLTKGTKDVPWSEATRLKIKTSMLLNRLTDHVLGNNNMSATQVRAAEILLNKTLANLSATEVKGEISQYVARLPQPAASADAWSQQIASEKATEAQGTAIVSSPVVGGTKH